MNQHFVYIDRLHREMTLTTVNRSLLAQPLPSSRVLKQASCSLLKKIQKHMGLFQQPSNEFS